MQNNLVVFQKEVMRLMERIISVPSNHMPCDYNGRKITVASVTGISVGIL